MLPDASLLAVVQFVDNVLYSSLALLCTCLSQQWLMTAVTLAGDLNPAGTVACTGCLAKAENGLEHCMLNGIRRSSLSL